MSRLAEPSDAELIRLDAIVRNLHISRHWDGEQMADEVVRACLQSAEKALGEAPAQGEAIAQILANHFHLKFEEVRDLGEVDALIDQYVRIKNEFGFALLRREAQDPLVDAWLFLRTHARESDPDRWVAVLNLIQTVARAYWNRYHELAHRIAEPQEQLLLPFRRERNTEKDPVEVLMDMIASSLGFHERFFGPLVKAKSKGNLTFSVVDAIGQIYCPSASLLSVANATIERWPLPALGFDAMPRAKRGASLAPKELRVRQTFSNALSRHYKFLLFSNMRVPLSSVVYHAFQTGAEASGYERGSEWTTSDGHSLPDTRLFVSAKPIGDRIYGIMCIE